MKQIIVMLIGLLLVGCGSSQAASSTPLPEQPEPVPSEIPSVIPEPIDATAEPDDNSGTIKPPQEVGEVTVTRTYISKSEMFNDPYCPTLVLEPEGTFVLTENLFSGMGHYSGSYTVDDYRLTLDVESTDFKGFAGDDVTVIEFEALSPDVIQLMTDLCGSMKFDYWYLDIPQ